jgi:hypothetical protein
VHHPGRYKKVSERIILDGSLLQKIAPARMRLSGIEKIYAG